MHLLGVGMFDPDYSDAGTLPYRSLLGGILARAVLDLCGQGVESYERMGARLWLMSRRTDPFSCIWVCEHLDIDVKRLRRDAWKVAASGKLRGKRQKLAMQVLIERYTGDACPVHEVPENFCWHRAL